MMKIDVNSIEREIYAGICEEFGQFCESRFEKHKSVLAFLRSIELETVLSYTAKELYSKYCDFCMENNLTSLNNTYFGRSMKACGFEKIEKRTVSETKKRVNNFYFRLR